MKTAIIGDLHGSKSWQDAIMSRQDIDKWIFIGDYVDSYVYDNTAILKNLRNLIALKLKYKDRVTLLIGNHDLQYIYDDSWYRCSGFREEAFYDLNALFNRYLNLFDIGIESGNFLITHAGITESWYKRFSNKLKDKGFEVTTNNLVDWLNDCIHKGPKELIDVIAQVGKVRGGFEASGGPLWADETELKRDPLQTMNQIVGHTPQKTGRPTKVELPKGETLIFCDIGEISEFNPVILEEK